MLHKSYYCIHIQRKQNQYVKKTSHCHIHCSTITTAKKWECPSFDWWIKKMWQIYPMEYNSSLKERNSVIQDNMDGNENHSIK